MPVQQCLRVVRNACLILVAVLLCGCASLWRGGVQPMRTSVSLSAPSTIDRPAWLQRMITAMDEKAFPGDRLLLKLSYELSPAAVRVGLGEVPPRRWAAGSSI
jgi:hypothetical protein